MIPLPILGPIFSIIGTVIDRVIPDKAAAERVKLEFAAVSQAQEFQLVLKQIETNLEEAKSPNWFVAGWRPAVGWTCAFGLAYVAVIEPLARFFASVVFGYEGEFPVIDTTLTMQVLLGLLGLAGMRSFEKFKEVEGSH